MDMEFPPGWFVYPALSWIQVQSFTQVHGGSGRSNLRRLQNPLFHLAEVITRKSLTMFKTQSFIAASLFGILRFNRPVSTPLLNCNAHTPTLPRLKFYDSPTLVGQMRKKTDLSVDIREGKETKVTEFHL
jgi:hypothetical protein